MPSRLAAPVLTVDAGKMHKVDPRNVESLFGMWTVFSKCAESIEGGKRLENLSWRLWNRETFCCEAQPQYAITPAIDVPRRRPSQKEIPALSSSVDSVSSEEQPERDGWSGSSPSSVDSALSRSRGKEKHITPRGLEKMIYTIKEQTEIEPLSPSMAASFPPLSDETPRPSTPSPPQIESTRPDPLPVLQHSSDSCYSAGTADSSRKSDHRGSDTSVSSGGLNKSRSIVHGFSPSPFSSSFRARVSPEIAVTTAKESSAHNEASKKKLGGMFTLGGSSGDDESSFEDRMTKLSKRSSLADRLKQSEAGSRPSSFKAVLQSRQIRTIKEGRDEDEGAIESDDEDMDESAIEEEDDSEWEDSPTESGRSSLPEEKPVFIRVDSRANLVSRKSLLTRGLHEPLRAAALAEAAMKSASTLRRSRTSSPNGPSLAASPVDDDQTISQRNAGITRSKPIICTTSNTHLPAHSPRTTRRNMLATELTESLRRHLLWERQQKSTTANAVFRRRHTAHNEMANLHEFPGAKIGQPTIDASKNNNSWNNYFDYGPCEYHTKGW